PPCGPGGPWKGGARVRRLVPGVPGGPTRPPFIQLFPAGRVAGRLSGRAAARGDLEAGDVLADAHAGDRSRDGLVVTPPTAFSGHSSYPCRAFARVRGRGTLGVGRADSQTT